MCSSVKNGWSGISEADRNESWKSALPPTLDPKSSRASNETFNNFRNDCFLQWAHPACSPFYEQMSSTFYRPTVHRLHSEFTCISALEEMFRANDVSFSLCPQTVTVFNGASRHRITVMQTIPLFINPAFSRLLERSDWVTDGIWTQPTWDCPRIKGLLLPSICMSEVLAERMRSFIGKHENLCYFHFLDFFGETFLFSGTQVMLLPSVVTRTVSASNSRYSNVVGWKNHFWYILLLLRSLWCLLSTSKSF